MKQDTVAPQDQADHELGLEIIRVLGLKRKRENGRIETSHGDKNPCGLARTLRHLSASPLEKHAEELLKIATAYRNLLRSSASNDGMVASYQHLDSLIKEIESA